MVDIPPIPDRYFTVNYIDFYQKVDNLSNRTTGRQGGAYAFVGPNWQGVLPEGVTRVQLHTNHAWIVGRTEVKGADDLSRAREVQQQFTLTALSDWTKGRRDTLADHKYEEWTSYDVKEPADWFVLLNELLQRNPPYGNDAAVMGMFQTIGVGIEMSNDPSKLGPDAAKGLKLALKEGRKILQADSEKRLGKIINHWSLIPNSVDYTSSRGDFDFVYRSSVALRAQPGQDSEENMFNFAYEDDAGQSFNGSHEYTITFPKGQEPPNDAFWSITMYDHPDGVLVENSINAINLARMTR